MDGRRPRYDFGLIASVGRLGSSSDFLLRVKHARQRCDAILIFGALSGAYKLADGSVHYESAALSDQVRVRLIERLRGQLDSLIWEEMPDGQLPLILSYLTPDYFAAFEEADDLLAHIARAPYRRLSPARRSAILSAEIESYGSLEQRR